jgi:hypothetical protein
MSFCIWVEAASDVRARCVYLNVAVKLGFSDKPLDEECMKTWMTLESGSRQGCYPLSESD